jgi:hypothetical protein
MGKQGVNTRKKLRRLQRKARSEQVREIRPWREEKKRPERHDFAQNEACFDVFGAGGRRRRR